VPWLTTFSDNPDECDPTGFITTSNIDAASRKNQSFVSFSIKRIPISFSDRAFFRPLVDTWERLCGCGVLRRLACSKIRVPNCLKVDSP
jgi:hypothetical protein